MRNLLLATGVPATQILSEPTGTDTLSSVRAVRVLLRERSDNGSVYVATSRYHAPRCLLLLRLAGVPARACASLPRPADAGIARRWYWRLRELPAIPYDALLVLWLRASGRL